MALKAVCVLEGKVKGTIVFEQNGDRTRVTGNVKGGDSGDVNFLPGSLHGFHIHQFGDYSGGCVSAGPHFNPFKKNHGGPTDEDRHAGDLGNITVGDDGVAVVDIVDGQLPLEGPNSIIGRSVVVHADPDDLGKGSFEDSKTTGHAGARLSCGVIGLAKA